MDKAETPCHFPTALPSFTQDPGDTRIEDESERAGEGQRHAVLLGSRVGFVGITVVSVTSPLASTSLGGEFHFPPSPR